MRSLCPLQFPALLSNSLKQAAAAASTDSLNLTDLTPILLKISSRTFFFAVARADRHKTANVHSGGKRRGRRSFSLPSAEKNRRLFCPRRSPRRKVDKLEFSESAPFWRQVPRKENRFRCVRQPKPAQAPQNKIRVFQRHIDKIGSYVRNQLVFSHFVPLS